MLDLITIGDATLDTFLVIERAHIRKGRKRVSDQLCLNFADKIPIQYSIQSVGGNAANVAVGAARLGVQTAILTELGDDINGHVIHDELCRAGVRDALIKKIPNRETRYSVIINFKSERTILSYHPKRSYTFGRLPKTKWIYYTSLGAGFERLQKKLIIYLKNHPNTKLAVNPGSYQIKKGLAAIQQILPRTDMLFVNKEEAETLAGKKGTAQSLAKRLRKKGVKTVVITDSIRGSYTADDSSAYAMKTYPIQPVAKTGAGDAYTSGFLSAIIHGMDISKAMQWGTANAGGVIRMFGAEEGLMNKTGIQRVIKKYPNILPKKAR